MKGLRFLIVWNKRMYAAVWLCAGIVIAIAGAAIWRYHNSKTYRFSEDAVSGSYEMPVNHIMENLQNMADVSAIRIQINARPELDAYNGTCNLFAGNPSDNKQNMKVAVMLDETEEILYESELLTPGSRKAYVTFDQIPEAGEHAATAIFSVLDPESGEVIGAVDAGLVIMVVK